MRNKMLIATMLVLPVLSMAKGPDFLECKGTLKPVGMAVGSAQSVQVKIDFKKETMTWTGPVYSMDLKSPVSGPLEKGFAKDDSRTFDIILNNVLNHGSEHNIIRIYLPHLHGNQYDINNVKFINRNQHGGWSGDGNCVPSTNVRLMTFQD